MDPLSSPLALDPLPLSVLAILISMTSLSCLLLCIYDNRSFEISTGTRWLTTLCTGHFIFLQLVQLTATLPMNSPYWPFQFPTIDSINCHPLAPTVDSVITHTSFLRVISTVSNRSALSILGRISLGWWPLNECLKKELSTVHLWQSTKKGEKRVWVMTESTVHDS